MVMVLVSEHISIHTDVQGTWDEKINGRLVLKKVTVMLMITSLNFQMTWLFYSFLFYSAITDNEDLKTTASTRLKQLPEYNSAEPQ